MEFKKEEEYMKIIKGFVIAFSIYSKIPVPQFDWKEEDMQYHLCFFPLIGLIIGALEAGWFFLGNAVEISHLCKTLIAVAIPLLVTGGFHMDGFMDTMDAFHSYQDKEKKLEILKDPHIGAFSVLMLVLYYLIYGAAYAELTELSAILVVGIGFALSRSLSGIGVVSLKAAKKDGMLAYFAESAQKKRVLAVLIIEAVVYSGCMIYVNLWAGLAAVVVALLCYGYYSWKSRKEFGGINGDTAGYFVSLCENAMAVAVVVVFHFIGNCFPVK